MKDRPLVLVSNDDGYDSEGIRALCDALRASVDVVVCAPASNQSATSHSLTLHRPLRLRKIEESIFALDGTPADCIYVALGSGTRVLPRAPELCVSGLNHGLNLGVDTFYSGTIAAAREAALRGIPAVALSADVRAHVGNAAAVGARITLALLAEARSFPVVPLLNVNFPPGTVWSIEATHLGRRVYEAEVEFRADQRGGEYLWIGGAHPRHLEALGSDTDAYDRGVVGVTPLSLDQSDRPSLDAARAVVGALR
jgi:5'-nucleotidase